MSEGCCSRGDEWCRCQGGPCDWFCTTQGEPRDIAEQPYTKGERAILEEWARVTWEDREPSVLGVCAALRYEATLRQVEAQRDALKAELEEVSADRDSWRLCTLNS